MSTAVREVMDAVEAPRPAPSMALVPLTVDRAPLRSAPRPAAKPGNAHRFFFALGYAGLALVTLGAVAWPLGGGGMLFFYAVGAPCVGLGGMGVLAWTLYRPSMRKLRQALGAVAALGLTAAAQAPLVRTAKEVHAEAWIAGLQPLADDLARDGRIRTLAARTPGYVELNGFFGPMDTGDRYVVGDARLSLAEVLRRDGISRLELVRMRGRMQAAGVQRVEAGAGYVGLAGRGMTVIHVPPGQVLPTPGRPMLERARWRTRPLGGGWYLVE